MQCNSKVTFSAMKKQEVSLESRRNTTIKWVCSPKTVCMLDFEREGEREKKQDSMMSQPCYSPSSPAGFARLHYILSIFADPSTIFFWSSLPPWNVSSSHSLSLASPCLQFRVFLYIPTWTYVTRLVSLFKNMAKNANNQGWKSVQFNLRFWFPLRHFNFCFSFPP